MIYLQTKLTVIDNSGAKLAQCLNISKKKFASVNDSVLISVKSVLPSSKLNKKKVYKAIILQTKKPMKRADGSYFRSDRNAAILVKPNNERLGNRIKSFTLFESNCRSEKII